MSEIIVHKNDLPDNLDLGPIVAIDSETMGLKIHRDELCLVQLSSGDGKAHIVQLDRETYDAPNLKNLLSDPEILKIFHFARFDVAAFLYYLETYTHSIYCTKIASKLCRTSTDRHGLKDLCHSILGVSLSKEQQISDWGSEALSEKQLQYAANDVLHLHKLKEKLDVLLERENRTHLAISCFDFLPTRAELDIAMFDDPDIFSH